MASTATVSDVDVEMRKWPEGGHCVIPHWIYSAEDVYEREKRLIFERSWNYVGLEAEVPNPGSYKRSFAGDVPVVIVRSSTGEISCFVNRCSHRGVELAQESCGEARRLTCPYHQWSFDLDGKLVAIPYRRGSKGFGGMPEDFDTGEWGLTPLQVRVRNGVIFASLNPQEPDLENWLGPKMIEYFDRILDGRELKVLGYHRQRVQGNWKLYAENLRDPYHGAILHVWFTTFGLVRADQPGAVELDESGRHSVLVHHRADPEQMAALAAKRTVELQDSRLLQMLSERDGPSATMQSLWPNLVVATQLNSLMLRHLIPRGPHEFDLQWTFYGYADDSEEMLKRRKMQANFGGPAGYIAIDDGEVLETNGRGSRIDPNTKSVVEMGGRDTEPADHIVTEVAIRAFYRHYCQVMGY